MRARVTVALLYTFFRWQTRIQAHVLPPAEDVIVETGFDPGASIDRQGGMVRTRLFIRHRDVGEPRLTPP